ncbi:MAG: Na+-transporting NADH:ubiquinone oxidoreductase subunit D [Rhodothermales bacterium]|jgi:Na+-transporting NADH:ubiquinone oxidoreductase subunit D
MADESEKQPIWSAKNQKILTDPFSDNNPVTVQVLGICSALAVTVMLKPSLIMGVAVIAVVAGSNFVVSLIRNLIPTQVRIIVEVVIVATLVIMVDQYLKAFDYQMSKQLSVFVGLIITNCIVLGRLEAFAMGNKPLVSVLDGIGNGAGYALVIAVVGFCREVFGSGSILGYQLIPQGFYDAGFSNNGLMVLPPGAFVLLGLIIWVQRTATGTVES